MDLEGNQEPLACLAGSGSPRSLAWRASMFFAAALSGDRSGR